MLLIFDVAIRRTTAPIQRVLTNIAIARTHARWLAMTASGQQDHWLEREAQPRGDPGRVSTTTLGET